MPLQGRGRHRRRPTQTDGTRQPSPKTSPDDAVGCPRTSRWQFGRDTVPQKHKCGKGTVPPRHLYPIRRRLARDPPDDPHQPQTRAR